MSRAALAALWSSEASLPAASLHAIKFTGKPVLRSSYLVDELAQACVGAAALAASQVLAHRTGEDLVHVSVAAEDAAAEFRCEQLGTLDGETGKVWDALAGQYKTADGWIRPHMNWKHHREGFLDLQGLPADTSKAQLIAKLAHVVNTHELAEQALSRGLVATSLRSHNEWDATPHGKLAAASTSGPVKVERQQARPPKPFSALTSKRPLEGVRVIDLTRVIAGPTAGRTLAAYGADVLWITAPHLPSLPPLDADTSRGKRTTQLDLRHSCPSDRSTFISLLESADVLLQSYAPNALASLGFSLAELQRINPDLVYASLNAWGDEGEWRDRKGFDSLVQFAVGINEAEGRACGLWQGRAEEEFEPKPLPCQALDHGSGYLTAFGILTALLRRATTGGFYTVNNSLLGTANFLRSLGRAPPSSFARVLETREQLAARGGLQVFDEGFEGKRLDSVRHAARFGEGAQVGWERAPKGYGDVEAAWLERGGGELA